MKGNLIYYINELEGKCLYLHPTLNSESTNVFYFAKPKDGYDYIRIYWYQQTRLKRFEVDYHDYEPTTIKEYVGEGSWILFNNKWYIKDTTPIEYTNVMIKLSMVRYVIGFAYTNDFGNISWVSYDSDLEISGEFSWAYI